MDRQTITHEEARRILREVSAHYGAASLGWMERKRRRARVEISVVSFVIGALAVLGSAYIVGQLARSLINGWFTAVDLHSQTVAGGAIAGALAVLGLETVAVAVWLAVRKSGR